MSNQEVKSFKDLQEELKELRLEYKKILKKVSLLEDKVSLENIHGKIIKDRD